MGRNMKFGIERIMMEIDSRVCCKSHKERFRPQHKQELLFYTATCQNQHFGVLQISRRNG